MTPDISPLRRFLAATDLDELGALREQLEGRLLDTDDLLEIIAVITDWEDVQALANLLMYPEVIAPAERHEALQRGLDDAAHPYLRLAAAVGLGDLDLAEVDDDTRYRFAQSLLRVVAAGDDAAAERAAFAVLRYLHPADAPDVVELLTHPSAGVRHNLVQGLFGLVGPTGVAALVGGPGFVAPEVQAAVRERLVLDGYDLGRTGEEQRRPLLLGYVPSYTEYLG